MNSAELETPGIRSPRQRLLNNASALFMLLALGCFLCLNAFEVWPFVVMAVSFVAVMLLLRYARVPWKARIFLTPLVAAAAAFAGAWSVARPSFALETVGHGLWPAFAIAGVSLAMAQVLSIFSFPLGYGERKV